MVLFLFNELAGEFQRGTDVLDGYVVFPLHLVEVHATRQAAHNDRDRCSRPANHGFAVADLWVDEDSLVHSAGQTTLSRQRWQAPALRARAGAAPARGASCVRKFERLAHSVR